MTVRCVIVDDSPSVLRAASELLQGQGIAVVGVAATGEEAVLLMDELEPDVVLVDAVLGPESGFDLVRRLMQTADVTGCRIILISTHDRADFADSIAASRAVGFLPKADLSAAAIHRLLAGAHDEDRC